MANTFICRSAGSLRRLWLLNTAYTTRVIQAPVSCSACGQVRLLSSGYGCNDKNSRCTLYYPAAYSIRSQSTVQAPVSCSACGQVRLLSSGYGCNDKIGRCSLYYPAAHSIRSQSTAQGSESSVDAMEEKLISGGTLMDRVIRVLRVVAGPLVKRTVLVGSARTMYECCIEGMNFEEFFDACELPDTFQSWFIVLHLHIWMCLVRLKAEGKDGRYMYKKLVGIMWHDVEERMKNLGTIDSVVLRDNLRVLTKQCYGLTIAFDEGLLCNDNVLAAALWRNFFYNKKHTDAEALARLVEYVRKNVQHLETYSGEHLLFRGGKFTWLPFKEEHGQQEKEKEHGQ